MFCKYCGAQNEDGSIFCYKCGQPLVKTNGAVADTVVLPEDVFPQDESTVLVNDAMRGYSDYNGQESSGLKINMGGARNTAPASASEAPVMQAYGQADYGMPDYDEPSVRRTYDTAGDYQMHSELSPRTLTGGRAFGIMCLNLLHLIPGIGTLIWLIIMIVFACSGQKDPNRAGMCRGVLIWFFIPLILLIIAALVFSPYILELVKAIDSMA